MKKSLKARLTAAAFAAATAFGLTGCTDVDTGIGEEQDVYGPPIADPDAPVQEDTTSAAGESAKATEQTPEPLPDTEEMIQCVYGPPESFQ